MSRLAALVRQSIADPRPDGALLAAFLADRDEAAFAELVRRHAPLVWGACRRGLPDLADAEDAFQATFLVLVRRANRLTGSATVGPWLYKVAAWTAGNLRRKNARRLARRRELSDAVPDPRPAAEPSFDLDDALLALPERYRAALVLCCLEGLTHREAADRLGCAEGTVSSRVSRGLAKLRARLVGRDPTAALAVAAAVLVPNSLSAVAARSAAAFRVLSAAASPAVAELTEGVLRMFWVKNATAAGLAAVLLVTAGVGVGVSVQQVPRVVAADPPKAAKKKPIDPSIELSQLEKRILELDARQAQLAEMQKMLGKERKLLNVELARARAVLKANTTGLTGPRLSIRVGKGDETHPYSLSEISEDRKASWSVSFYTPNGTDPAPVREYLTRVLKGRDAPKAVHLDVMPDASLDQIKAVLETCRAVGLTRISIDVRVMETVSWIIAWGRGGGICSEAIPGG